MPEFFNLIELALLGLTAIITLTTALYVGRQANRHFLLQRATHFIERFNSGDLRLLRPKVDRTMAAGIDWDARLRDLEAGSLPPADLEQLYEVLIFANFFQELATALAHGTIAQNYTWDVFGGLVKKYWHLLQPFIEAKRRIDDRPSLFADFEKLVLAMEREDRRKGG